ncbi:MAG: FAD-dependent oxidoreductase [Oscillospiraceae bacterium]
MTTNKTYDVAVIGAGVIGTSCAYHLVKKGLSVALVDRNNVARGTSSHCDAVALIVDKQPGVDAAMGYASIQRFLELQNELDSDFELHQRGCLYACDTEQEMEVAAQYARDMQADGYNVNALSPKELLEHEPFLAKDLIGGLFSDIDLGLNPYKLCFAFVDTVLGKGLDLYTYTNVTGVRLDGEKRVQGVGYGQRLHPLRQGGKRLRRMVSGDRQDGGAGDSRGAPQGCDPGLGPLVQVL